MSIKKGRPFSTQQNGKRLWIPAKVVSIVEAFISAKEDKMANDSIAEFMMLKSTAKLIAEMQAGGMELENIFRHDKTGTFTCAELLTAYYAWINPAYGLATHRVMIALQNDSNVSIESLKELLK